MTGPAGTAGTQPTIGDNPRSGSHAILAAACTTVACAAIAVLVARRGAELGQAAPLILAAASPRLVHSDLTERRLPNRDLAAAYTGTLCVVSAAAVSHDSPGTWLRAVAASLALFTAAAALTVTTGQFGGGDTKLIAVIGLALGPDGWTAPVLAVLYGFLVAAVAVAVRSCVSRPRPSTIALGPFLLMGAFAAALAQATV